MGKVIGIDELRAHIYRILTGCFSLEKVSDSAFIEQLIISDDTFKARVSKIAPKAQFTPKNVETKSQRAKLVFKIKCDIIENPKHKLKPGMPAGGAIRIKPKASWKSYRKP